MSLPHHKTDGTAGYSHAIASNKVAVAPTTHYNNTPNYGNHSNAGQVNHHRFPPQHYNHNMSNAQPQVNSSHASPTKSTTSDLNHNASYQAVTSQRTNVINRSISSGLGSLSGGGLGSSFSTGNMSKAMSMERLTAIRTSLEAEMPDIRGATVGREKSKKDMQELNERLANHLEKSRFLNAQNKKLKDELHGLKARWGKETEKIRQMYDVELKQLRKLIDDAEREKGERDARVASLELTNKAFRDEVSDATSQNDKLMSRLDQLNLEVAEKESELGHLRRRVGILEEERKRDRGTLTKAKSDVLRGVTDLENETAARLSAESQCQTLREELEFLKRVHDQQLKELQALVVTEPEQNREFWRNELSQAIHDLQKEFDDRYDSARMEMETLYLNKIREFKNTAQADNESAYAKEENVKLKVSIQDLRDRMADLQSRYNRLDHEFNDSRLASEEERRRNSEERDRLLRELESAEEQMQRLLHELKIITDVKLNLEIEIMAYRKLLESEEGPNERPTQDSSSRRTVQDHVSSSKSKQHQAANPDNYGGPTSIRTEMTAKTQYDKSFKGNIAIEECSSDGRYVQIHNTGNKVESLNSWRIIRHIDNGRQVVRYTFGDLSLEADQTFKIWARGQRGKDADPHDLESPYVSWGTGAHIHTVLYNADGEERAVHVQKTAYGIK